MKTENKVEASHDKIKAIKEDIKYHTQATLDALTKDYNTYVLVEVLKDSMSFLFRPDDNKPEETVKVFTYVKDPRDNKWMITTYGGDFHAKVLYQVSELCNLLNHYNVKNIEKWFK